MEMNLCNMLCFCGFHPVAACYWPCEGPCLSVECCKFDCCRGRSPLAHYCCILGVHPGCTLSCEPDSVHDPNLHPGCTFCCIPALFYCCNFAPGIIPVDHAKQPYRPPPPRFRAPP